MVKEKEVKVTKIVINVGGKEVEFTPEEAKELTKILSDMFGEKDNIYVPYSVPYYPPYPHVWWSVGYNTDGTKWTDNGVTIYCSTKN